MATQTRHRFIGRTRVAAVQHWLRVHWGGIVLGLLILAGLCLSSLVSYLLFHSLAELFTIVVACGVFVLAWNTRGRTDNDHLLFVGIAYLFVAVLHLVHALGYVGMGVFPGHRTDLPTQLWISARYLEACSLLAALLLLRRRLKPSLAVGGYAAVVSLLLPSVFLRVFPACFVEGQGLTPFKKVSEYIISLVLLGSAGLLHRRRTEIGQKVFRLVGASILLTAGLQIAFTFYVSAYGLSNLAGHVLKLLSFYLIYKAVIQTGLIEPHALSRCNDDLRTQIAERERAEGALQESQAEYPALYSGAPAAYFSVGANRPIARANEAAAALTGYPLAELAGMTVLDLYAEESREKAKRLSAGSQRGMSW